MRLEETTRTLRALGDETRLRMLALLEREELSVSELQEALNMGQSRISTQLTQLREAGLVQDRRSGRRNFYQLTTGRPVDFLDSVLDPHRKSEEFQRDQEGLKAVLARRREDSRSYFDRVAAAFGEQVLPGRTWEGLSRAILRLAPRGNYADLGIGDGLLTLMLAQVAPVMQAARGPYMRAMEDWSRCKLLKTTRASARRMAFFPNGRAMRQTKPNSIPAAIREGTRRNKSVSPRRFRERLISRNERGG